jgi:hypothetical protein
VCEYAKLLHVWHQSHCTKFYNDLDVGYVGFIINACAGGKIPAFGLQGYVAEY